MTLSPETSSSLKDLRFERKPSESRATDAHVDRLSRDNETVAEAVLGLGSTVRQLTARVEALESPAPADGVTP